MTETRTATLAEFLLARIAEDEEALATTERFPHSSHGLDPVGSISAGCPSCRRTVLGARAAARIGAECEAKRRLVAEHDEEWRRPHRNLSPMNSYLAKGRLNGLWVALQLLALPYADHPDYREEWRV